VNRVRDQGLLVVFQRPDADTNEALQYDGLQLNHSSRGLNFMIEYKGFYVSNCLTMPKALRTKSLVRSSARTCDLVKLKRSRFQNVQCQIGARMHRLLSNEVASSY
jgi:hypothetical protein